MAQKAFKTDNNRVVENSNSRVDKIVIDWFKFKKSKNDKSRILIYFSNIKAIRKSIFLTSNAKKAFNYLK